MLSPQLKKIFSLIKKTGDRVIIVDENNPNDTYVLMDFDTYANQFDKSNEKDKTSIKENKNEEKNDVSISGEFLDVNKNNSLTDENLTDKINREISSWKNKDVSSFLGEEGKARNTWKIPPMVRDKAQEVE